MIVLPRRETCKHTANCLLVPELTRQLSIWLSMVVMDKMKMLDSTSKM